MLTSCNTKPQRGVTMVASRFRSALCDASRLKNGWYKAARKKRAFRYATLNPCRVPTARYPLTSSLPAIETAGRSTLVASYLKNHCQMPMASLPKLESIINYQFSIPLLCLTASYTNIADDTLTFSESSRPSIGIRMCAVAARRHCSVSPVDSVPMTIAVPTRMSTS